MPVTPAHHSDFQELAEGWNVGHFPCHPKELEQRLGLAFERLTKAIGDSDVLIAAASIAGSMVLLRWIDCWPELGTIVQLQSNAPNPSRVIEELATLLPGVFVVDEDKLRNWIWEVWCHEDGGTETLVARTGTFDEAQSLALSLDRSGNNRSHEVRKRL